MKKVSNMLWGIVLIIIGVIFGMNALGISDIDIFFDGWWTLFIIVPCFIGLFSDDDKTGNLIGLVIGVILLLGCQGYIRFYMIWKLIVPTILILVGLSFIFKDTFNRKIKKEMSKLNRNKDREYYATFSGQNINFANEAFTGCSLNAVFGGLKCDLRDAMIHEDCILETSAIFGGITIYVPENINVKVTSTPIFGGVTNHCRSKNQADCVTVYINALCMFGGVDIK